MLRIRHGGQQPTPGPGRGANTTFELQYDILDTNLRFRAEHVSKITNKTQIAQFTDLHQLFAIMWIWQAWIYVSVACCLYTNHNSRSNVKCLACLDIGYVFCSIYIYCAQHGISVNLPIIFTPHSTQLVPETHHLLLLKIWQAHFLSPGWFCS